MLATGTVASSDEGGDVAAQEETPDQTKTTAAAHEKMEQKPAAEKPQFASHSAEILHNLAGAASRAWESSGKKVSSDNVKDWHDVFSDKVKNLHDSLSDQGGYGRGQ